VPEGLFEHQDTLALWEWRDLNDDYSHGWILGLVYHRDSVVQLAEAVYEKQGWGLETELESGIHHHHNLVEYCLLVHL
jgi:hypothetical protein